MNLEYPQIGFDRFIQLEWAATALRIRAGISTLAYLMEVLDSSHAGLSAKRKTRTVLNRLWLEPHPNLVDFADRGVVIYRASPETTAPALTWGMALASYPFFGRVTEIVGRLTGLQGDCTSAEVHRRMAEIYGERESIRRKTNVVLQSQANWGAIERGDRGKLIVRKEAINLHGSAVSTWLAEACLRYSERALRVTHIESSPIIYPFILGGSTGYLLSRERVFELGIDSAGNQVIGLAS